MGTSRGKESALSPERLNEHTGSSWLFEVREFVLAELSSFLLSCMVLGSRQWVRGQTWGDTVWRSCRDEKVFTRRNLRTFSGLRRDLGKLTQIISKLP